MNQSLVSIKLNNMQSQESSESFGVRPLDTSNYVSPKMPKRQNSGFAKAFADAQSSGAGEPELSCKSGRRGSHVKVGQMIINKAKQKKFFDTLILSGYSHSSTDSLDDDYNDKLEVPSVTSGTDPTAASLKYQPSTMLEAKNRELMLARRTFNLQLSNVSSRSRVGAPPP